VLAFLAERCFQNADSRVPAAAIWEDYEAYCRSQAVPGLSAEQFFTVLQELLPSLEIESEHVKGLALLETEPRQKRAAEDASALEPPPNIKPLLFESQRICRQSAIHVKKAARLVRETVVVVEETAMAMELCSLERIRHASRSRHAPV
jgi:hypothetical protein